MGLRRTYQSSLLFRDLTVRDNLFLAVRGVARGRFGFLRPRAAHPSRARHRGSARPRAPRGAWPTAAGVGAVARPAAPARDRHGAGGRAAPHPVRRAGGRALARRAARAGGAAHRAARPHEASSSSSTTSTIALRVGRARHRDAQRPRARSTARRPRSRATPRCRPSTWAEAAADALVLARARPARTPGRPADRAARRLLRPRARRAGGVAAPWTAACIAVVGPQRHGQDHAVQRHHRARCRRRAACGSPARRSSACRPHAITRAGRRLRAAGPARVALAHGRRAPAPGARATSRGAVDGRRASTRLFPRLAERRGNGGCRALRRRAADAGDRAARCCSIPILLVMDEPTEGLAPVIVRAGGRTMLKRLAADGAISVLLIEQNLGVAIDVADTVDVMVNGRIARSMPASELAADRDLQQRLLGVTTGADDAEDEATSRVGRGRRIRADDRHGAIFTVRRSTDDGAAVPARRRCRRAETGGARLHALERGRPACAPRDRLHRGGGPQGVPRRRRSTTRPPAAGRRRPRGARRGASGGGHRRARRLYRRDASTPRAASCSSCAIASRSSACARSTVDLATSGKPSPAMIHPREVARHHPEGERAVFTGDRGSRGERDGGGLRALRRARAATSAASSRRAARAAPRWPRTAMRRLPIGVPKVMVSTVASGDVKPYVGPSDICMMYSVTDVAGINRISERVLANAAHALAGMIAYARARRRRRAPSRRSGSRMFGVTTPCVQAVTQALEERYDCLVFHATGTGGQSMEKLVDSGLLAGVIDVTTTEIADEIVGGVLSAGPGAPRRDRPRAGALRRLVRRARHGELLGHGHGARAVPRSQPAPPQPQRDADAHDARGMRAHRPASSSTSSTAWRARCGS